MTFEAFLVSGRAPGRRTERAVFYAFAAALHGAVLVAAALHTSWRVEEITPAPATPVTLRLPFLPTLPTSPASPPPPRGQTSRKPATEVKPRPTAKVQPPTASAIPTDTPTTATTDTRDEPGPPGDPRGVPEGTGEGSGTGTGQAAFVAPNVATGQLAIDPQADAYRVKLPPALARAGVRLWALVRLCARPDGRVHDVKILKGADAALDPLIVATLGTWRYRPYAVNGRPVPFCTNVRYEIAAQ